LLRKAGPEHEKFLTEHEAKKMEHEKMMQSTPKTEPDMAQ
jgi:hypothetical protein